MKETKEQKELKKKAVDFLVDEWEHGVPLDRLTDREHMVKVIKWIQEQHQQDQRQQ